MKIYNALSSLGIPVCHPPYKGNADTYITYQFLGQTGQFYAEGKEAETAVLFALELISPVYNPSVVLEAKQMLEDAGYIVTVDMSRYDDANNRCQVSFTAETEGAEYG
ncbi:MAG: hypothetical protein IJX67_12150 [Oscillospiraceae bacterium]|nr:hypothetical protein [Oscillospiraceae bacterium]